MTGMIIKNGITIEEGSAPDTEEGYGKVYVGMDHDLHYLDGYGEDVNITDGYNTMIKSIFIDATSGSFSYDTNPAPTFRKLSTYWQVAALDGTYTSGTYQEFRSKAFQVPSDYASGGILKVYGFLDSVSANVFLQGISASGVRVGGNTQSLSWYGIGTGAYTISNISSGVLIEIGELDLTYSGIVGGPIAAGDIVNFNVQRRAGDVTDTASSGYFGIMGAEFFYNANFPKKTY